MLERSQLEGLIEGLRGTALGPHLVLVGSAAIYLTPTTVSPMTADADFAVEARYLAAYLSDFLADVERLGFAQVEDTATFTHPDGPSFDLLGLDAPGKGDRLLRFRGLAVLAFEDLCRLVQRPGAVREVMGIRVLSPAALVMSKLQTARLHKGVKDKVQALAMIGQLAGDEAFVRALREMAEDLEPPDWDDVLADAQAAMAGLDTEEARHYASLVDLVSQGLGRLQGIRERT